MSRNLVFLFISLSFHTLISLVIADGYRKTALYFSLVTALISDKNRDNWNSFVWATFLTLSWSFPLTVLSWIIHYYLHNSFCQIYSNAHIFEKTFSLPF